VNYFFVSLGLPELRGSLRGEANIMKSLSGVEKIIFRELIVAFLTTGGLEEGATSGSDDRAKTLFYPSAPANGWPCGAEPIESDGVDELVEIRGGLFCDRTNLHLGAGHLGGPFSHSLFWFLDGILFVLGWNWWIL
jgi:hypothetical protein